MTYILNHEGNPHLRYFEDIAAIPRGSYNEKGVADYICKFAEDHGLEYNRDKVNNIIIRKPATAGYEDHPAVCMQGHMDMVCEKAPDKVHDFTKDPIELRVVDGDWLMGTDTTLGGDDGVAVALMLAILAEEDIPHPDIECIFTMGEEAGVIGAQQFDFSLIKARKYIGLDGVFEGTITVLTAGVVKGFFHFPVAFTSNDKPVFKIHVKGLTAGHGGKNMANEQANAIKVIARGLCDIKKAGIDYAVADINGGTYANAIAEECWVTIAADASDKDKIADTFAKTFANIQKEHSISDPDMYYEFSDAAAADKVLDEKSAANIIGYLFMSPTGCYMRSLKYPGVPTASRNLGTISIEDNIATVAYQFRASATSMLTDLFERGKILADFYGGTFELETEYHGYEIEPTSPMHDLYREVYKEVTGKEADLEAAHYGTDTGTFLENIPDMDILVISPILENVHTPMERCSISSFNRNYLYLKMLLERC